MSTASFDTVFARLGSSKFRASFRLSKAMREYAKQKGLPMNYYPIKKQNLIPT